METIALIGHPVSHSVSPIMHNAAFAALALDYRYIAVDVPRRSLPKALGRLRRGEWSGANVTIPHKQTVLPQLDGLSKTAADLGAVNTLHRTGGRMIGDNTDVPGFLADLDTHGVDVAQQPVLIFGTGGSARAVAFALLHRGAEIRLLGRNLPAGAQMAKDLHRVTGGRLLNFEWTPTDLGDASQGCVLAVNCTPLGMTPNVHSTPWFPVVPFTPQLFIYDLVYNPKETMLVRQARSHGLRVAGGLGMLVQQGALAIAQWTNCEPPIESMRDAAQRALDA